jgi:hypothetical protein
MFTSNYNKKKIEGVKCQKRSTKYWDSNLNKEEKVS